MVERIRVDVTPSEHVTASAYSAAARASFAAASIRARWKSLGPT
ncbi:MAG: hypothetical protein WA624_23895 [Methylocella sp.]